MNNNNFAENTAFGLIIADMDDGTGNNYMKTSGEISAMSGTRQSVDALYNAKLNYWGHHLGPRGQPTAWDGQGVVTSLTLNVAPFLSCIDSKFGDHGNAQDKTSLFDEKTKLCIKDAKACPDSGVGDMAATPRKCVSECPSGSKKNDATN